MITIPIDTPEAFTELAWAKLKQQCCVNPKTAIRVISLDKKDFDKAIFEALDAVNAAESTPHE